MEKQHGSIHTQGKRRAQIRIDGGGGGGGNFGGLVVWGGALAVAGLIAVSAIIGRRGKRGDDATKKKYRSTKLKEDAIIGDLQAPPPSTAFQQNQCCTGTCGSTAICETQMVDSCEVVSSRSLMVVEEVSTPVINEGNAEYSPSTDLKEESTSSYDQVENSIEEETTELADKMNSEDVSSTLSIQEKEQEEEEEQQQRQEDEDDEEEETTTTVDDQMTSEDVSSVLSIPEKEKEEEEQQQQADEGRDFDEGEEVNSDGTGSTSTESVREAISPAESIATDALSLETKRGGVVMEVRADALSLETKKGGVVMELGADALSLETKKGGVVMELGAHGVKECDHESNRTDDHGTTTENPVSQTPREEGNLKPIVDSYETIHSTSMSRRLWRSWSILVLLAMGLLLFTHLSSSVRHLLHLDSSLVP